MNRDAQYTKLFAALPEAEPSAGLAAAIASRIGRARIARSRLHAALHGTVILGACVAMAPAVRFFAASAARSGFSEYMSLAWSDGWSVLGSWKMFLWSIADSAPVLEASIVLALVFIFANSLRRGAVYVSSLRTRAGIAVA